MSRLTALDTAVLALATYRLSRLVTTDELTAPLRDRLIATVGEDSPLADLLRCDWCTSMWIAAALALASRNRTVRSLALIPAWSAVAGLISTLDSYLGIPEPEEMP